VAVDRDPGPQRRQRHPPRPAELPRRLTDAHAPEPHPSPAHRHRRRAPPHGQPAGTRGQARTCRGYTPALALQP
jgi:hypothetical protein